MSSNLQWEPNRRVLGEHLRMLLVEQPGHGRSPGPDDPVAYRATTIVAQLEEVRQRVGVDRMWLVGQSLGGAIAIRYALAHPDRVAGLVFTNSRAVFGLAGRRTAGRDGGVPDEFTRDGVRALPYHPANAKRLPPDLQAKMIEAADRMPMSVFRHLSTGGPWDSTDDLKRLTVPTMLINGRYEKVFQPHVAQAEDAIADLRVVTLDGGHSVNIDQPDAFNAAVLDFITG